MSKRINRNNRNRKQRLREMVSEYKARPCVDCGVQYPPYVMDLDHVRGDKDTNVAQMVSAGYAKKRIMEELLKCEVVCANCHRMRTFG